MSSRYNVPSFDIENITTFLSLVLFLHFYLTNFIYCKMCLSECVHGMLCASDVHKCKYLCL